MNTMIMQAIAADRTRDMRADAAEHWGSLTEFMHPR